MKKQNIYIIIFFITIFMTSCASKKNVLYLQDVETYNTMEASSKNIVKFKKNDEITINVTSVDKKSAIPFNLPLVANVDNNQIGLQQTIQPYLINENGNIQFPVLGRIHVQGLTRKELTDLLTKKISKYVKDPIINVRILNFTISVIGEVRNPGVFRINNERVSIIDALSLAGDLSIYGDRKEVLIIRETENYKKETFKIDLTQTNFFDTEFYYLQQNDVVMVSPNDAQVQSSVFNRNTPLYVSIASLLLSVLTIFAL